MPMSPSGYTRLITAIKSFMHNVVYILEEIFNRRRRLLPTTKATFSAPSFLHLLSLGLTENRGPEKGGPERTIVEKIEKDRNTQDQLVPASIFHLLTFGDYWSSIFRSSILSAALPPLPLPSLCPLAIPCFPVAKCLKSVTRSAGVL